MVSVGMSRATLIVAYSSVHVIFILYRLLLVLLSVNSSIECTSDTLGQLGLRSVKILVVLVFPSVSCT